MRKKISPKKKSTGTTPGILALGLLTLTSGCGGQAYNPQQTPQTPPSSGNEIQYIQVPTPEPSSNSSSNYPTLSGTAWIRGTNGQVGSPTFNDSSVIIIGPISTDDYLALDLLASPSVRAQKVDGTGQYAGCAITSACTQISVQVLDHETQKPLGLEKPLSANTSSSDGTGSCGKSATASPKVNLSSALAQFHGAIDLKITSAQAAITSNSCGYVPNSNYLSPMYYTYSTQLSFIIHKNNAQ